MLDSLRRAYQRAQLLRSARRADAEVRVGGDLIHISRDDRTIILGKRHIVYVPHVAEHFDTYWGAVVDRDGVVDYSAAALHTYRASGLQFWTPAFPEEAEAITGYFAEAAPRAGDTVFDIGAHAGVSTYHFSQVVGAAGRVVAFEPEPLAFDMLTRNIDLHQLRNVLALRMAVAGESGARPFTFDGTLGAAFADLVPRGGDHAPVGMVKCLSLADACVEYGVPAFVKLDVEGAEIEVIESARDFLRAHPMRFVVDTSHPVRHPSMRAGETDTAPAVERVFARAGYRASSRPINGLMTTWAAPSSISPR